MSRHRRKTTRRPGHLVVAIAVLTVLVAGILAACSGSAPADPAPRPALTDWHDAGPEGVEWACERGILLFRASSPVNGGFGLAAVTGQTSWCSE